jgi:hypothetical protein
MSGPMTQELTVREIQADLEEMYGAELSSA